MLIWFSSQSLLLHEYFVFSLVNQRERIMAQNIYPHGGLPRKLLSIQEVVIVFNKILDQIVCNIEQQYC